MPFARFGAACAALALVATPALAQTPNWRATPVYGTLTLEGGFTPDPAVREVRAGGTSRSGVEDCPGYLNASAPDLDVSYSGSGNLALTFSAASSSDVAVLVHTPDGRWFCDDDGAEAPLNAKLTIQRPGAGTYSVWVLTYAETDDRPLAYVGVSELEREVNEDDPYGNGARGSTSGAGESRIVDGGSGNDGATGEMPNWMATPLYGEISLSAGFTPDPHVQTVTAGGRSRNPVNGNGCRGYINLSAPDFEVNYEAGTLPLHFYVTSDEDTSLLVYTADGRWICDDDGGEGLNPHIEIASPASGSYQIWVGTYGERSIPGARLHVSELTPRW